jgi:rod shape-determining protein MreB
MWNKFINYFSNDIGIDLGTANTLVYLGKKGIVINEPSVVAVNTKTNTVVAVGKVAKEMLGKTPTHIKAVRPVLDGVIADFEVTEEMLSYLIKKANSMNSKMLAPRVVVGIPSKITEVEIKAVYDAAKNSGAREVYIVEEPMAGAIGVGLPIHESVGSMVIDIGGGTTDIAVMSLFGIVKSKSIKIAGDKFNSDIINYLKEEYKLVVGDRSAEDVKIKIGSVLPTGQNKTKVRGQDMTNGLPKEIEISDLDIAKAIKNSVVELVEATKLVIQNAPPEILSDIIQNGAVITGGGAYINGLAELLSKELNVPVKVTEDPMSAVAKGAGKILENIAYYKEVLIDPDNNSRNRLREINE